MKRLAQLKHVMFGALSAVLAMSADMALAAVPRCDSTAFAVLDEDTSITVDVRALASCFDPDGDPIQLRDSVRADDDTVATAVKSGNSVVFTPVANYNGITGFTFRVENFTGGPRSDPRTRVTVTVNAVNDPPTIVAALPDVSIVEDTPTYSVDLASVFADIDGDILTLSVSANSNPALITSAVVDTAAKKLVLTIAANVDGSSNITVRAADGLGAFIEDTFAVTVTGTNDTPVAVDDTATVAEDAASGVVIAVLGNDQTGDAPVTVEAGVPITLDPTDDLEQTHQFASSSAVYTYNDGTAGPVSKHRGFIDINGDGTVTYTPNLNANGPDTFSYTIVDADGERSTASVTVTVTTINDPPSISDTSSLNRDVVENTEFRLAAPGFISGAFDAETGASGLSAVLLDPPDYAAVFEWTPAGGLRYQPTVDYIGADSFRFQVTDGALSSTVYTFNINVTDDNATDFDVQAGEVEFDFQLANNPLELSIGVDPNVLIVMDDSGSMDWTHATNEDQGRMNVVGFAGATRAYAYNYDLPTNSYGTASSNGRVIPSQQAVDLAATTGTMRLAGNQYGVWRSFNADYNPIYYNPRIRYTPWLGVGTNNVDFPNACPGRASIDPYQFPQTAACGGAVVVGQEVAVNGDIPAYNTGVPRTDAFAILTVAVAARPWAHYYAITDAAFVAGTRPAWNTAHQLVEIVAADDTYDGGPDRTDCANPSVCTYAEEMQNFANWFTYYRSREYSTKNALGRVVANSSGLRIGYAVINNVAADALRITLMNTNPATDAKRTLLDQIYEVDSFNGTPLRSALDRAGRHYECTSGDSFGSTGDTNPGDAACPVAAAPAGQCQQNFTLMFTDGAWNGDDTFPTTNHDANGAAGSVDSAFDGGSFSDAIGGTLADVAMNYYERDLQDGLANEVPVTARDISSVGATEVDTLFPQLRMYQHMTTYTIGFGLLGALSGPPAAIDLIVPWGDPIVSNIAKVDDLLHAAYNGRGSALSASDPKSLNDTMQAVFDEFSAASGAASAVSFDAARLNLGTTRFRGLFNTRDNSGQLLAERLEADGSYSTVWEAEEQLDGIASGSRVVVSYNPTTRVGIPFTRADLASVPGVSAAFTDVTTGDSLVNYFRGDRSNERPSGLLYRDRPKSQGLLGDIVHSTPLFVGPPTFQNRDRDAYPTSPSTSLYSAYKTAQAARQGVVYVAANDGMLHGFNADTGAELFGFIPNKLLNDDPYAASLQDLASSAYTHRFFNDLSPESNDVFITPRTGGGRQWRSIVVGGLGGGGKGIYAIDATLPANLDDEANAVNQILWEFTDTDDTPARDAAGDLLVDEFGVARVDANGLPVKDLGYAYTEPQIQMTNPEHAAGIKKWAVIFGNGYNSTSGVATLFVVFVEAGIDGWQSGDVIKVSTGVGAPVCPDTDSDGTPDPCTDADVDGRVGFPNGLGSVRAVDADGNGTVDFAYGGDQLGNLYRFDLRSADTNEWTVTRVFQAKYDNGTPLNAADDEVQPITTRPIVIRNPQQPEGFIVIVGTGSYVTTQDATNEEIQSIYGIWDRGESGGFPGLVTSARSFLVEQSYTNVVNTDAGVSSSLRTLTSNCVEYGTAAAPTGASCPSDVSAGLSAYHRGWYIDLNPPRAVLTVQGATNPDTSGDAPPAAQFPGERAIRNIQIFGGFGFVNSVIPREANTCVDAPGGFALIFNPATGGTGSLRGANDLAFDLNNDGRFDADDRIGGPTGAAISGSRFDGVPGDSTFIRSGTGAIRVTQESTGDVDQRNVPNSGADRTGRLSWQELN